MNSRIFVALSIGALTIVATAGAQTKSHAAPPAATPELPTSVLPAAGSPRIISPGDSSRNYDAQALRFESRWGSVDIIRVRKDVSVRYDPVSRTFRLVDTSLGDANR